MRTIWGSSSLQRSLSNPIRKIALIGTIVLVVEDEWLVRDDIVSHLRASQMRTIEAHSGEAALSLLERGEPVDIVFTDIQLGGPMDGWMLGERVRILRPSMPVIFTSGQAPQPNRAVTGSLFIPKPYQPAAILNACRILTAAGGS